MQHQLEVFVSVNESGDAACSLETAGDARETLIDEFGGAAVRTVRISVLMDLPEVVDVEVEVPAAAEGEPVEVEALEEHEEHDDHEAEKELETA
jgi:hypothetical protein